MYLLTHLLSRTSILVFLLDKTPFVIHMQLTKTFLIPVLLYGSEIFANCYTNNRRKLNLIYNNIAKYVFINVSAVKNKYTRLWQGIPHCQDE